MNQAAGYLAAQLTPRTGQSRVAFILGSGLGGVTQILSNARTVPYSDIPGLSDTSTAGHAGVLLIGSVNDLEVFMFAGRSHYYEGKSGADVAMIMRTIGFLGIQRVILCSAAGGISPLLTPGSLMLVSDVINLSFRNPLLGPVYDREQRFSDMSDALKGGMNAALRNAATMSRIELHDGVYGGVLGPSYETKAEIRMLRTLGADCVGMSTVPEVIVARANGLQVSAVCCITNKASGLSNENLSHADVLRVANESQERLALLLKTFLTQPALREVI